MLAQYYYSCVCFAKYISCCKSPIPQMTTVSNVLTDLHSCASEFFVFMKYRDSAGQLRVAFIMQMKWVEHIMPMVDYCRLCSCSEEITKTSRCHRCYLLSVITGTTCKRNTTLNKHEHSKNNNSVLGCYVTKHQQHKMLACWS